MPHIWLQAIDGQYHPTLLLKELVQALFLMQMHRDQLFIAMQRMFHGSFTDPHPSLLQVLMDFFDASMLFIAQCPYQSNHIQSALSVRQGPSPLFFWPIGTLVPRALLVAATPHLQCQTT